MSNTEANAGNTSDDSSPPTNPQQLSDDQLHTALAEALNSSPKAVRLIDELVDRRVQQQAKAGPESLWNAEQVYEYLNISERKFRDLVAEGEIQPIEFTSRLHRFDPGAIKAYVRRKAA